MDRRKFMIVFAYPVAFLLIFLPFIIYFLMPTVKGMHGDALKVPFIADLKRIAISSGNIWQKPADDNKLSKKFWALYALWLLLTIACARPQFAGEPIRLKNEGRDIMLVLDISTSMTENDFVYANRRISRLDAVKKVVSEFADKRANDRIGLVLFGTRAYLQSPLTFDKASVKEILWSMKAGMAGDSTSIGDALGLALKNLRDDKNKDNKIIILLTDGENNDGSISMGQAIKLAKDENIKTYTIGVGAPNVFFKMIAMTAPGVDEQAMKELAKLTKGRYFRADNTAELQKIYQIIDQSEPTLNDERFVQETTELYYIPVLLATLLGMLICYALRGTK